MSNPNEYDVKKLDLIVDGVRKKYRDKLAQDPNYFGTDPGTAARVAATLNEDAPKGTLAPRGDIDINSTASMMHTVDLTILNHAATTEEVEKVARRAADEHCATVCLYPEHVPVVVRVMQEEGVTDVPPIAVVGFPAVSEPTTGITAQTVQQTKDAIAAGAKEIDMVLPTSFREDRPGPDGNGVYQDHYKYIKAVVSAAHEQNIPVKVILETAYLTDRQIAKASVLSKIAGADWVKTSTGFAEGKFAEGKNDSESKGDAQYKGATPHDVALMRRVVGDTTLDDDGNEKPMGVKASGGVRTREQAQAVLAAGADRIGASGGIDVRTTAEKVANQNATPEARKTAARSGY